MYVCMCDVFGFKNDQPDTTTHETGGAAQHATSHTHPHPHTQVRLRQASAVTPST